MFSITTASKLTQTLSLTFLNFSTTLLLRRFFIHFFQVQAHERSRRKEETRIENKNVSKMKRKIKLTRNKSFLSERVIVQLRQQVEMLTGQLRLADDRFTELRGK